MSQCQHGLEMTREELTNNWTNINPLFSVSKNAKSYNTAQHQLLLFVLWESGKKDTQHLHLHLHLQLDTANEPQIGSLKSTVTKQARPWNLSLAVTHKDTQTCQFNTTKDNTDGDTVLCWATYITKVQQGRDSMPSKYKSCLKESKVIFSSYKCTNVQLKKISVCFFRFVVLKQSQTTT